MESIYSILSKEVVDSHLKFIVEINPNHAIYKGHFPDMPIVPGVVLLQIVKELSESTLNKKLQLKEASNIKFLKMILPNKARQLEINLEIEGLRVKAAIGTDGNIHCKMNLVF